MATQLVSGRAKVWAKHGGSWVCILIDGVSTYYREPILSFNLLIGLRVMCKVKTSLLERHLWGLNFFFNFLFYIGVQLIYNVVLVSDVQQSDPFIRIHVSLLFWVLFSIRLFQNIVQSSLCYIVRVKL